MRATRVSTAVLLCMALSMAGQTGETPTPPQWQRIDQLCGDVELTAPIKRTWVVNGKRQTVLHTNTLDRAKLSLYPGAVSEGNCCRGEPITETHSRKHGAFEISGVKKGDYWLLVQSGNTSYKVPLRLTDDYEAKVCRDSSVGRSVVVDSVPPKVEIRIR